MNLDRSDGADRVEAHVAPVGAMRAKEGTDRSRCTHHGADPGRGTARRGTLDQSVAQRPQVQGGVPPVINRTGHQLHPMYHTPVLLTETLDVLALQPGDWVIDATVGDGGHSVAMLERIGPTGRLLGLDANPISLDRARQRVRPDPRITFVHANFTELSVVADEAGFDHADVILFDLGIASWQLDEPGLGLSFQRDEPLDMRLDPRRDRTAAEIVNRATPGELMTIFEEYGGLNRSRPLVDRIVAARRHSPIETTRALANVIGSQTPRVLAPLFQALRIAVNDESESLDRALTQAIDRLAPGGRLVVISFHSGEDRIVKQKLRAAARSGHLKLLTTHPMIPIDDEIERNPRSRSAKLRGAIRTDRS